MTFSLIDFSKGDIILSGKIISQKGVIKDVSDN